MKDFYQSLGYLIFGSRLKRLSEYYLSEINAVYKQQGIDFDASWFPVFYLLSQHQPVSIQELSDTMMVSHSASSQLVSALRQKGLLVSEKSKDDARKQNIRLTDLGGQLLNRLLPVWDAINEVLEGKMDANEDSRPLLSVLSAAEKQLLESSLADLIVDRVNARGQGE